MGKILIGTASWTDKSLLTSGWYPPEASTPETRLAYYAGRFAPRLMRCTALNALHRA
ncbi:hypothetical protein OG320_11340 [Microbispora sp. NBC_01189]|uniref:hypothetical protein n=1 Tax=Microbispora sp. NBC_01189 TaxID=2903583 RepID=UPI002E0D3AD2|nr:hypothetical protein OG320_11340 [Microbispora sp. NBC_01189]